MAYYLLDDQWADDPIWDVLSDGKPALRDALQSAHARLCSKAAHQLTDGYLTEQLARQYASRAVLDRLCRPVLSRAPRLHRQGDECPCLGDEWIPGYPYRLHRFLRRNPSRAEHARNKAQKADRRDPRLKRMVWERDGGCCRYCRSGPLDAYAGRARDRRKLLQYDHVDPDAAAGADGANFVVACGACNEYKGHRTPAEADMVLLPVPTEAERRAWLARTKPLLLDRGESPPDRSPIDDESMTERRSDPDPAFDPAIDRAIDSGTDPPPDPGREPCPDPAQRSPDRPQTGPREGAGSGRGGDTDSDRARRRPDTPRSSDAPDPYTGRSRAPAPPAYPRCRVCQQRIDPAAGTVHPACADDNAQGWPPGTRPATRPGRPRADGDP